MSLDPLGGVRALGGGPRPRVAFVLSGGGSLGAVQAGQLAALAAAGVFPDLLVGCSAGALNAAFMACDPTVSGVRNLVEFWWSFDARTVFPSRRAHHLVRLARGFDHVEDPAPLRALLSERLPVADVADAAVPLVVVTTNLTEGRVEYHSSGPLVELCVASASLPGVFPPVTYRGGDHVDGGVLDVTPISAAVAAGAERVFVLDCAAGTPWRGPQRRSALGVLTSAAQLSRRHLAQVRAAAAAAVADAAGVEVVVLPAPDTHGVPVWDSSRSAEFVTAGFSLAAQHLAAAGLAPRAVDAAASGGIEVFAPPPVPAAPDPSPGAAGPPAGPVVSAGLVPQLVGHLAPLVSSVPNLARAVPGVLSSHLAASWRAAQRALAHQAVEADPR